MEEGIWLAPGLIVIIGAGLYRAVLQRALLCRRTAVPNGDLLYGRLSRSSSNERQVGAKWAQGKTGIEHFNCLSRRAFFEEYFFAYEIHV